MTRCSGFLDGSFRYGIANRGDFLIPERRTHDVTLSR